jgi:hypothetical protein
VTDPAVPSTPPLGHLIAALADRADVQSLTQALTGVLADALPPGMVQVDYKRSLGDRMAGRTGTVTAVSVATTPEKRLSLQTRPDGTTDAVIAHSVRGVTIARNSVTITDWIAALATELTVLGEKDATARQALHRLLLE